MADKYSETDLIQGININYDFVKNIAVEQADKCVGSIRSILEYAVKLFWLKKYDKKPVWVKGYTEVFDLHKAITDERFSRHFSKLILADMHAIRQTCNGVLHDNDALTLDDAKDLLARLEKCVKAVEVAIPMKIIDISAKKPILIDFATPPEENTNTNGGQKAMSSSVIIGNSLHRDLTHGYGGSAQPIYDACCDKFGWDKSRRYLFGKQQLLYAKGATREGCSPWFLVHSNLTDTKGGNWSNTILQDIIEELWEKPQYGLYHDETMRVTFAKTKPYGYVFIRVYKLISINEKTLSNGSKVWIKTYQRIADTYPIVE